MPDGDTHEPDRVEGVPHPRRTLRLIGQDPAQRAFLRAVSEGRIPHAWLIAGPRGTGKATMAWRIARALLAERDLGDINSLDLAEGDPLSRRIAALAEPRLFLMRRTTHPQTGKMRETITIDVARQLKDFLTLSAADGGRRVVIVDAADEMNMATSNAILKLLEEPPARVTLLLVTHATARLLPTIRSRCRVLRCAPLDSTQMADALSVIGVESTIAAGALAELSSGSVGEAARLVGQNGPALYQDLVDLLQETHHGDRSRLIRFASGFSGSSDAGRIDVTLRLIDLLLLRLARHGAGHPPAAEAAEGEAALLTRLSPGMTHARRWAELQQRLSARAAHGRAVNLDPSSLILDMGLAIKETAGSRA